MLVLLEHPNVHRGKSEKDFEPGQQIMSDSFLCTNECLKILFLSFD